MAIVTIPSFAWPDPVRIAGFAGFSSNAAFQINGSGQRAGYVFTVPRSGTVTKVGVMIRTCASAVTSRAGLYTWDASAFNPTSTLYGGSNYGTFTPAANTYFEITLGTSATMTRGDIACLMVDFDSTAGDMFLGCATSNQISKPLFYKYNGATWGNNSQGFAGHVYYSDSGGIYDDVGMMPWSSTAATGNYNVNTAGADEYALRFTPAAPIRIAGAWDFFTTGNVAHDIVLYEGTTALATKSITLGVATVGPKYNLFDSSVTLSANTVYRLAIKPTSTTNITYRRFPMYAAGMAHSVGLSADACESTRLDSGSWSDTTTNLPAIGLIVDGISDGAGGGLLRHPGMTGGVNG